MPYGTRVADIVPGAAGPILVLLALTIIMPFLPFGVALLDFRFALPARPSSGYVLSMHLGRHRPTPDGLMPLRRSSFFDLWAAGR